MKRIKPKPKKQKKIAISETQLNRIKREITDITTQKAMLLILLATADEKELNDDELEAVWKRATRYANHLDEHVVKLREVQGYLEKATGVKINGW